QNLDDLVRQISAIEDPTLRAKKAIEIFGSRGGIALANALKPGITSLDTFEISASDAAGATEKAAGIIEDKFENKITLAIKHAGAAIIGFGQTIGPLGSALTGLVSIAGALGPQLGHALSGAWKAAAESKVLGGAIKFASDKAATLYLKALFAGDATSGAISGAWHKVIDSGIVKHAAERAGAVIGLIYATATEVAEHVVEIVKEAWHELSNKLGVKAAATKAGTIVGAVYGQAVAFGTKIGEVLGKVWAATGGKIVAAAAAQGGLAGTAFMGALYAAAVAAAVALPVIVIKVAYSVADAVQ